MQALAQQPIGGPSVVAPNRTAAVAPEPSPLGSQAQPPGVVYKIQAANERMELIVNTSRILTLEKRIPQAQVNNPDILDVVPLSPTQVQVSAKKPGVTAVNLWTEDKRIYTVDVMVIGDARELAAILRAQFPKAALQVVPIGSSVMISGYVDQPDLIPRITRIAEEYYPKIINNMTVSGVQQVALHVKIYEVSRTKLRRLGFDFANVTNGSLVMSGISGLLATAANAGLASGTAGVQRTTASTFRFDIGSGSTAFFGVMEALRQDNLAKILAEPTLVTISGRPASFHAGGSFWIVPQGLAASAPIQVNYGTNLDFVPIVLGNGRIRLEIRPTVSQVDPALNVQGYPGLLDRSAETGCEVRAGQTLAIAGLVQVRSEAENRGLPWVSEVPYLGAAFRRVNHLQNETELLILVTPELAEPMDCKEVPPCGPGCESTSPCDWDLFMKGHLEVPNCCPPVAGAGCAPCVPKEGPEPIAEGPMTQAHGAAGRPTPAPRNPQAPSSPNSPAPVSPTAARNVEPGFIGPIGYDVLN
jgi:pilus assembly protein CpaC